jgi:hypothetical protein
MPYINPLARRRLDDGGQADTAGELNYQLTRVVAAYLARGQLSYARINEVLGALEGAKQEFYRRVAVPYEEDKLKTNGDVY